MAYSRLLTTKDGRQFYKIEVSRGRGKSYLSTRWYVPDGWSKRAIDRELKKQEAAFEDKVKAGEVVSHKEQVEREIAAAAAAAQLKTFKQYAESVFMPTKLQNISENTRLSYTSNLENHLYPVIGNMLLVDITPAIITNVLLEFQKTHSHGSSVKLYNVLNGVFEMALFDDSIPVSPMNKVKRPKQKKDDKALTEADKALDVDELNYVLECAELEPPKWKTLLYLAADTGCRRGELVGLQWSDIDWKKKTVSIRHNLQYSKDKGIYDVTPKGGRFRTVDLGDDTIAVLMEYRASLTKTDEETTEDNIVYIDDYRKRKEEEKEKKIPKWIFTVDGSEDPMHPTSPTHYFRQFGKRYGVPGFHPHLLRHTSASLSLTHGGDVKSIADRLGHKDASVTLRMYAHANDESIRAAGQAARDALKNRKMENAAASQK